MTAKEIFGKRLLRARKSQGVSLRSLSEALNQMVSHTQLAKYEAGKDLPSGPVVMALSEYFGMAVDDFFRTQDFSSTKMAFRKLQSTPKKEEGRIRNLISARTARYLELEDIVNSEKQNKLAKRVCSSSEEAEDAAVWLRKKFGIEAAAIANLTELLEENCVKIFEIEAPLSFFGCSGWVSSSGRQEMPLIVLNKDLNRDVCRKRFTIAHELGHLVLNFPEGESDKNMEAFCHRFAGAFLLPGDALKRQIGEKRGSVLWRELFLLKQEYGISAIAVVCRLFNLDIISEARYVALNKERNRFGWHKEEPCPFSGVEDCLRFRQLVYRGMSEKLLSDSKAAYLLEMGIDELHRDLLISRTCGADAK